MLAVDGVQSVVREKGDGGEEPHPRGDGRRGIGRGSAAFEVHDQRRVRHAAEAREQCQHVGRDPVRDEGDAEVPPQADLSEFDDDAVVDRFVGVVLEVLKRGRWDDLVRERVERGKGFVASHRETANESTSLFNDSSS